MRTARGLVAYASIGRLAHQPPAGGATRAWGPVSRARQANLQSQALVRVVEVDLQLALDLLLLDAVGDGVGVEVEAPPGLGERSALSEQPAQRRGVETERVFSRPSTRAVATAARGSPAAARRPSGPSWSPL